MKNDEGTRGTNRIMCGMFDEGPPGPSHLEDAPRKNPYLTLMRQRQTPMAGLAGVLTMFQPDVLSAEQEEYIRMIFRA